MKKKILFIAGMILSVSSNAQIFQQDFSSGTTIGSFHNASNPTQNQFSNISTITNHPSSIADGKLRFAKGASNGSASFVRNDFANSNTDFLHIQFKYQLVSNPSTGTTSQSKFFVGSGFPINGADPEGAVGTTIHSSFDFQYSGVNGGFKVASGSNVSAQYTGQQLITLVVNNTIEDKIYLGPNGISQTALIDTYDLWVGTDKVFQGIAAKTATSNTNGIMFFARYNGLTATYEFDDLTIHNYQTLPVTLTSFTAAKTTKASVGLKWETIDETNNSHFEIYRSEDGKKFNKIQTVAAKGNNLKGINVYTTEDLTPAIGTNYYKLVQIDRDGTKTEYPRIVSVRIGFLEPYIKAFNNGAKINLEIVPEKDGLSEIIISDISGRTLYKENALLISGVNKLVVNKELASGIYLAYVKSFGQSLRVKFVK